jgi:hypothetical protein
MEKEVKNEEKNRIGGFGPCRLLCAFYVVSFLGGRRRGAGLVSAAFTHPDAQPGNHGMRPPGR